MCGSGGGGPPQRRRSGNGPGRSRPILRAGGGFMGRPAGGPEPGAAPLQPAKQVARKCGGSGRMPLACVAPRDHSVLRAERLYPVERHANPPLADGALRAACSLERTFCLTRTAFCGGSGATDAYSSSSTGSPSPSPAGDRTRCASARSPPSEGATPCIPPLPAQEGSSCVSAGEYGPRACTARKGHGSAGLLSGTPAFTSSGDRQSRPC